MENHYKLTTQPKRELCSVCWKNPVKTNWKSIEWFQKYKKKCSQCERGKKHKRRHKWLFCAICWFIWQRCQLDIHHIDLNHKNNNKENLLTVCSNCHRLIHFG